MQIEKSCDWCGKKYVCKRHLEHKRHFCSKECWRNYQHHHEPYCGKRGVRLELDKNWKAGKWFHTKRSYICDKCWKKRYTAYYVENREKIGKYSRQWNLENHDKILTRNRQTLLRSSNGKRVRINKRQHPEVCEICGKKPKSAALAYHHWDDNKPQLGIWICTGCHTWAEAIEKKQKIRMPANLYSIKKAENFVEKYLLLKKTITENQICLIMA